MPKKKKYPKNLNFLSIVFKSFKFVKFINQNFPFLICNEKAIYGNEKYLKIIQHHKKENP